jgi:hypothetical protein
MKKLVAAYCCILFLQTFSNVSTENDSSEKTSGKKVLVKAIAIMVNTEANKKLPARRIFVAPSELPLI